MGRLRIALLGVASPVAWMPHLVDAFKRRGDVITIGPSWDQPYVGAWPRPWPPEGHIVTNLHTLSSLYDVLPVGWHPDLVVAISGGGIPMFTRTQDLACPTVFYSVDTWQCYMDYLEAPHYDFVFAGQRRFVPFLKECGSPCVSWLPLACNPAVHVPLNHNAPFDVAFVGGINQPVHWQRKPILEALSRLFKIHLEEHAYGNALSHGYHQGQVAFNHAAVDDLNMRVFEVLAMGRPLVTNQTSFESGLFDIFTEREHLYSYADEKELVAKISSLLSNPEERSRLGEAGRELTLAMHTYEHRVDQILRTVQSSLESFPARKDAPRRINTLLDALPHTSEVLLDIGMSLPISKYGIARHGVRRFVGYSPDAGLRLRRQASYHEVLLAPSDNSNADFDVAVIGKTSFSDESVEIAWRALSAGGTLVVHLASDAPFDGNLEHWLLHRDFRLISRHDTSDGAIVVARKRTRRLRSIAEEVCNALRVPGLTGETVGALLDPDW